MTQNKIIYGKIVEGRKKAASLLAEHETTINQSLGVELYRGSLNFVTKTPLLFNQQKADLVFDNGLRYIWQIGSLDGKIPLFAYRWQGCPLQVVELLSPVRLRDIWDFAKNPQFFIEVDKSLLLPINPLRHLLWSVLWQGREEFYYTHQKYTEAVYKMGYLRKYAAQNRF